MSGNCQICNEHPVDCQCYRKILIDTLTFQPLEFIEIPDLPKEKIDHPTYYQGQKFEVIDIIEDFNLGFTLGNAIKYILRAGKKDSKLKDLKKAIWYLNRECENIEKENLNHESRR